MDNQYKCVISVTCQVGARNEPLRELLTLLSLFLIKEEDTPKKGSIFMQFLKHVVSFGH